MNTARRFLVCLILLAVALAAIPAASAQTPSLALAVVIKGEDAVAFVDPATGKVMGRVATGEGPHELVASADRKLAFVSN